uniref:hypothetical protein n=1 Tax=Dialister sp. TaxID=1955814 RepID=UPI003FEE9BAF
YYRSGRKAGEMIRISLEKLSPRGLSFFHGERRWRLRVFAKYGIIQPIACKGENYARLRH